MWDLAIISTDNGGDVQLKGNDLVVVNGTENMLYLGMFGGNVEQVTNNTVVEVESFDWWGNNLFMPSEKAIQFNSIVEKTLNSTALTSSGRAIIENAIKKDLEFFSPFGTVEVTVTIVATDRIDVTIKTKQNQGQATITVINFKKKASGDWFILDFNNDFFFG